MNSNLILAQHTASNQIPSPAGTVLIVCPGGLENGGGIGRQMGYFLQAHQADGARLTYRVVDSRGPWFLGASPLHVVFSVFYVAGAMLKLLAARNSVTPSIAHFNITGRGSTVRKVVLATLAGGIGLRYLLHVHDPDYAEEYLRRGAFMKWMLKRIFCGAQRILVLGARDREILSKLLQLPPDRVTVLHNAVPDPHPDTAKARQPGEPHHLLFLGHLSERKGVPELLHALASPALKSRCWRATLAGGGPIDEYRRLAADLGIAQRIEFPGWLDRPRVRALFAEAEVLVLPSHAEGLAMAVLEGLSHGLVVVTTPVGAHEEVIEPEVSGVLVPPGDVEALADALLRIIEDEQLRDRLHAGARHRFLEEFDVRAYVKRLSILHDALLADRRDVGAMEKEHAL